VTASGSLALLLTLGGCTWTPNEADLSGDVRTSQLCGIEVSKFRQAKMEALEMRSLEQREVGKCTFIRGDDGDDVFLQFGDSYINNMGNVTGFNEGNSG
jgi:hypothetical protein